MADWSTFYLATGGAAATLLGLLFIAVQFNIDTFVLDPGNKWRALARSTFSMFTILFFLPLLLLVPGTDPSGQGIVLLAAASYGAIGAVLTWLPVWRSIFQGRRERLWQTAWLLIAPLLVYSSLAAAGWAIHSGSELGSEQYTIAYTIVGLFSIALRNSWSLLFELTYERKQKGPPKSQ